MNALVMYDRQTGTLWSQFLSLGVRGPLAGTTLEHVPVLLTTFEAWTSEYPDSKVLRKEFKSSSDVYDSYYASQAMAGVLGRRNRDDRLPLKELVVGTGFDIGPKAFPHSILEKQTVVNDTVAGSPALVWFDPDTETALVYERQVDGQVLTFDAVPGGTPFAFLRDRETGTTWSPLSGIAIEGPLRGKALKRIHATNVFWFAWADFYPETVIYQAR